MYLTPEWSQNRYGETIFFEEADQDLKKSGRFKAGNERYETLGRHDPLTGFFLRPWAIMDGLLVLFVYYP